MKVHADLKKLLEAYDTYMTSQILDMNANVIESRLTFLASNSLASVEPEPLAKNKDSGSKCDKGGTFPCFMNLKYGLLHCTECDKTE